MDKESILLENAKEYYSSATEAKKERKYNTAITLFYKTISAISDLYILKKEGFIPSSHAERFRILKEKYRNIYRILDKNFPFYQESYVAKIDKDTVIAVEEDVKELFKITETNL